MLKPRKRKPRTLIMYANDGSLVGYRGDKRIPISQEAIDGFLLVYHLDYYYPQAPKVVREVLDRVRRKYVKAM